MYAGSEIVDNQNLNDYQSPGRYLIKSSSYAVNGTNYPSNTGGYMDVVQRPGANVWQYYHTFGNAHFARVLANGAWSSWTNSNADIQAGEAVVTPSAPNTPTPYKITFPHPFSTIPIVVVSSNGTVPGTTVTGISTYNISKTGFTVYVTRTNITDTGVRWIAVAS